MNESALLRSLGWLAYANGALSIVSTVTLVTFFAVGGAWGTVNDAASVLWALAFVPLALLLYQLHRPLNPWLSMVIAVFGIVAMMTFAVLQSLLVFGVVRFEQTLGAVLAMGAVIGLWALFNGIFAQSAKTLPAGLVWTVLVFGVAFVISALGFWLGGEQHPLAAVGFLIGAIANPIWSIWLGRLLLSGRLSHVLINVTAFTS